MVTLLNKLKLSQLDGSWRSSILDFVRLCRIALMVVFFALRASASIFIMAICKDGVVAVADSRMAFSDVTSATDRPLAYADGLNKITRFDSALLAATGQGFIGEDRFDDVVRRFAASAGPLAPEAILPGLIRWTGSALRQQHLAVAKFANGKPVICGYDGQYRSCIGEAYVQSSPTDFENVRAKLTTMSAMEVAAAARSSMQRYITAKGKGATMGGEFPAVVLTAAGARDLWTLKNPIQAGTIDELVALVRSGKIQVTLVPPATRADLDDLLDSGPVR